MKLLLCYVMLVFTPTSLCIVGVPYQGQRFSRKPRIMFTKFIFVLCTTFIFKILRANVEQQSVMFLYKNTIMCLWWSYWQSFYLLSLSLVH